jgi:hypothetical protein
MPDYSTDYYNPIYLLLASTDTHRNTLRVSVAWNYRMVCKTTMHLDRVGAIIARSGCVRWVLGYTTWVI